MYSFITWLKSLPTQRWPWLLLAGTAFCLNLSALYFQYGLKLEPCLMCIYERVAMYALVLVGLFGAIQPRWLIMRLLAFAGWGVAALWGLALTIEHQGKQTDVSLFSSCDFIPNFPSWLPLHEWLPSMFTVGADCSEVAWIFLGFTMVEWLILIFSVFSALFISVFAAHLSDRLGYRR